ncbi:alpha/beta fold hydrolase [Anaerococcus hydrogenalis]|uniref:alpha/beta fold hydrolase n=1 Tax=Anaerococcus hydrogenalis TaxID=33029 RepID=UPI00288B13F3|nr:alpha/beta hydrolase [Anaerococcus hydrogenalis]
MKIEKVKLENGETMAYRHVGHGENKVILIHGFQSSSQFFEDLLESLDENIEVFAPDLIGYGESSYENKHKEMADWAKDLKYFSQKLNLENFSLAGWSLGGHVAMDFAGLYPDLIKNLILIASVGVKGFIMPKDKQAKDDDSKLKLPNFLKNFNIKHDHSFTVPILNGIKDKDIDFFEDLFRQTIYNVNDPNPDDLRKMAEDFLKQRCFLESLLAMVTYNNTNKGGSGLIEKIDKKVTWLHGDKDMVVPIDDAIESIGYFPNKVDFIKFDNSGHAIFVDEKEKFIKIFEDLVKNED